MSEPTPLSRSANATSATPPLASPKCDGCGKRLVDGDAAWLVPIKEIKINGGIVTQIERDGVYCEGCHE